MKIRNGFVSNSSSSSFVIISSKGEYEKPHWAGQEEVTLGCSTGCYEFGWEFTTYSSIEDRINFCYIQARDINNEDWIQMLEEVIKGETNIDKIIWNLPSSGLDCAYIDHQSSSTEGMNTEMFESKETLRDFIFNSCSYIKGGNDNV